jgi:glycerate kinase
MSGPSGQGVKILVAPAAWKGTFTPRQAAAAIVAGVTRAAPDAAVVVLPISDGGDGLLEAVLPDSARRELVSVPGPLGLPVQAPLGWLDEVTAIFECAAASGLALVPRDERDPLRATTRGVGELIRVAAGRGARIVVAGLGGSATVDGGTGAARALGWRFFDAERFDLAEGGATLSHLASVVPGPRLTCRVVGVTDVTAPLTGPQGAAPFFGPQKGAKPDDVLLLGAGLERLARVMVDAGHADLAATPGGGAAGGLGAGLMWFAGGELVPGAPWVFERIGFDAALAAADAVITCEGRFDRTSLVGKATGEVLRRAEEAGRRAVVLAGAAEGVPDAPVVAAKGLVDPATLSALAERAMREQLGLSPS